MSAIKDVGNITSFIFIRNQLRIYIQDQKVGSLTPIFTFIYFKKIKNFLSFQHFDPPSPNELLFQKAFIHGILQSNYFPYFSKSLFFSFYNIILHYRYLSKGNGYNEKHYSVINKRKYFNFIFYIKEHFNISTYVNANNTLKS